MPSPALITRPFRRPTRHDATAWQPAQFIARYEMLAARDISPDAF